MLHAFLLRGLALHLRPEDLRRPFAEGLLDDPAGAVGDAVELVGFVVQLAVEALNSCFFSRFVPGCLFQALHHTPLGVVANQPRALEARRCLVAAVPGRLGVVNLAGNRPDMFMLVRSRLWNGQAFDHTHFPGTERHQSLEQILGRRGVGESQEEPLVPFANGEYCGPLVSEDAALRHDAQTESALSSTRPSEPRPEKIIQRLRAFGLSALPAKESRKGTPCRIPVNDQLDVRIETAVVAAVRKPLPGESGRVLHSMRGFPPVSNVPRVVASIGSTTCPCDCRIQRRVLAEDVGDQPYSPIGERCSADRAKVTSGDVKAMRPLISPQVPDEYFMPSFRLTSLLAETLQVEERCPLTLGHHVVRALCLLLGGLDSLARLRRLNGPHHQLPAEIGVRQDRLHVDALMPSHRFPPSARAKRLPTLR